MKLPKLFHWKEYEYEEKNYQLEFLELESLTDKNICDILQLFDQFYGNTDQETTEYALEFQILTRMLVCHHAILVNPMHLALEECITEFEHMMSKTNFDRFVAANKILLE